MNARRVAAAEGVILAALKTRKTAAGVAIALESACLLQSPETAAEQRAEVIAERDAQVVAWLVKKAAEYGSSNRDSRTAAEAVGRMADKLSRGAVRDDETGVSLLYRLRSENNQLMAQVAEVCGQRDAWHDWADTLAYKVAPVEVLGRHGEEGKFPWDDALKLITPAAEVAALRARVAELEAERHSTNEALSKAMERLAELEALTPAPIQTCRTCGAGYTYGQPCGICEFQARIAAELRQIEAERPEAGITHRCGIPLVQRLDCGHCPHEVCQDCERCPHFCRCGNPQRQAEDPHDSPLHHDYALGRELPEVRS
ncbi:hypothetical protein [Streptomyces sp. NPDC051079]|uniref:hypothetical protein n=1 Tax=Streptomyces sp. NPDC051079 TaxID=3155043 RepID=UPI00344F169A